MHISFDSIDELDAFVARWSHPDEMHISIDLPDPVVTGFCQGGEMHAAIAEATTVPTEMLEGDNESTPVVGEPAKRKRRTKAEIAADEAAAGEPEAAAAAPAVEVKGNPFATEGSAPAAAIQAILDAPNQQAASLAGMAAVSLNALPEDMPTTVAKQAKPTDPAIIKGWIRDTAVGNIGPVDLMAHMTRAKAFIAKHGTAKYNESFALAGLTPNIMEYEDEQRSLHTAALEFVAWE